MRFQNQFAFSKWLTGAVLVSFALALLHFGPLYGSTAALVVTVLLQFYLSGYLLARVLGRHRTPNWIVRFGWILASSFALNVSLGAGARLLHVPVPAYVVILHVIMIALVQIKPVVQTDDLTAENEERGWRTRLPLYALVILCCLIVLDVGLERGQYRFNGYEDQTVFIELTDWLSHDNDDPGLRSRRIGVVMGDPRWDSDGWTYNHAAWVWSSGVPAAPLIWFDLTPLFVPVIPLVVFALAYEVTRRESAAAWTVAALTLFGLLTVDSLVYYPSTITFGQFSLFQVNTLRTISTALVTPLALLPAMAYLRKPSRRDLVLLLLAGIALATLHPRQIVILLYSVGATGGLWLLAQPTRARMRQAAMLGVVLAALMIVPFAQRLERPHIDRETDKVVRQNGSDEEATAQPKRIPASVQEATPAPEAQNEPEPVDRRDANPRTSLVVLNNLPLIGSTYIIDPAFVFYHPIVLIGTVLCLAAGWWWRRSLAAQYLFGTTLVTLALLFMPVVAALFGSLVTPALSPGVIFAVPIPLALGLLAERLLALVKGKWGMIVRPAAAVFAAFALLALLFEPFPIPASARDQIRASNQMQSTRDLLPADLMLVDALQDWLPRDQRSILLTPDRIASAITESVPYTFVTGGRDSSNLASADTARFFTDSEQVFPWLDRVDYRAMLRWGVTHIVIEADDARLAPLLLQPERFEQLGTVAGFYVFRVVDLDAINDNRDQIFFRMNQQYDTQAIRRWTPFGFDLTMPPGDAWQQFTSAWRRAPSGDLSDFGEAFSLLASGRDDRALPLFESLHSAYPEVALFTDALAYLHNEAGQQEQAKQTLLAVLNSHSESARVLAARTLLTADFFYLLDDSQRAQVLDVPNASPIVWDQLANLYRENDIRQRVVLLMGAGEWEAAAQMQASVRPPEALPADYLRAAALQLVQGDVQGAMATLQPTTSTDLTASNRYVHADQWVNNVAAQAYYRLLADLAQREGRTADAETALEAAYAAGAADRGLSLLSAAETGRLYAMLPEIEIDEAANTLSLTASYGNPHGMPYAVRELRVQVTSPDASTFYASQDVAVSLSPDRLTQIPVTLELAENIPLLTSALVYIEPRYDNRVTFGNLTMPVILNRPDAASLPNDAQADNLQLGDHISLEAHTVDVSDAAIDVTLYWQTDAALDEGYQVFVHVLDENGGTAAQQDSAPVENRYPTDFWRLNTLIEDTHRLLLDAPLAAGEYRVVIGMYRLPDAVRLAVAPADDARVENDAITLETFTIGG